MTKKDFIHQLARKTNITNDFAEQFFNATIAGLHDIMTSGDTLTIQGFGSFTSKVRAARTGRNPSTGLPIDIEAKTIPVFKPAAALKDAANQS